MRHPNNVTFRGVNLSEILKAHQRWMCDERDGEMAVLYKADLENVSLGYANLYAADLRSANLSGADLRYANLVCADLGYADLSKATLTYSNLTSACLYRTNISGADFEFSNCSNLYFCDAIGPLLDYRKGKVLPESIIGYKRCYGSRIYREKTIVTLEIPRGAIVFSINGNKCRTNKAKVIGINGTNNRAFSIYNRSSYYVGDEISINNFDCRFNVECASGVHFFMTREEAEQYHF